MHRFLLTPRWLAFHLLVLVAIPVCVLAARWQYDRYSERTAADTAPAARQSAPAVPLASALPAGGDVTTANWDRLVTVSGHFDARQYLVPAQQNGTAGYYVLGLLRQDGGAGAAVPVNEGFLASAATAPTPPAAPAGLVSLTGRLEPPDDASNVGVSGLPPGQLPLISPAILVNQVSYPLANGYVVRVTGPAPSGVIPATVSRRRAPTGDTVGPWQNIAYVVQWGAFSVLILGFWVRVVTREARLVREREMDAALAALTGQRAGVSDKSPEA